MSDDLRIATVEITRDLTDDHDQINVTAVDGNGDDLPLVEALGLLEFAKDTIIRDRMGEAE